MARCCSDQTASWQDVWKWMLIAQYGVQHTNSHGYAIGAQNSCITTMLLSFQVLPRTCSSGGTIG